MSPEREGVRLAILFGSVDVPTADQRRFLELLKSGVREHADLEPHLDFADPQVAAAIRATWERKPPWVYVSVPIPAMVGPRPTWYELTAEGRAIVSDI